MTKCTASWEPSDVSFQSNKALKIRDDHFTPHCPYQTRVKIFKYPKPILFWDNLEKDGSKMALNNPHSPIKKASIACKFFLISILGSFASLDSMVTSESSLVLAIQSGQIVPTCHTLNLRSQLEDVI